MIQTVVHMNSHPAIGVVTDSHTGISMLFHRGGGQWVPIAAIRVGSPDVRQLPECFTVPDHVHRDLDSALGVMHP